MDFIFSLFGRFHPLLVHLPIGFLLLGILFLFYSGKNKETLFPAIKLAFLWGSRASILSAASGLLLYLKEGYTFETVKWHLILGCLTTISAIGFYFYLNKVNEDTARKTKFFGLVLVFVLTFTGHLGGSLTHGEDYLVEVLPEGILEFLGNTHNKEITGLILEKDTWEESLFYADAVQPILSKNCNSCHNPKNNKGGLVLTSFEEVMKGGKNGPVIFSDKFSESPLIHRLLLPKEDKEHMPPKDKRQPSKEEIILVKQWVESGASFEISLSEAGIKQDMVETFFLKESDFPVADLPQLSPDRLQAIKSRGILVEPLSSNSNLIKVASINVRDFGDQDWHLLEPIKQHVAILDLSETEVGDQLLTLLQGCDNLTVLKLNKTSLNGESLGFLKDCKNLKKLYLNKTQVDQNALSQLNGHSTLEIIYVFDTPASLEKSKGKEITHSAKIEYGHYELPSLPTDGKVF
jgi:uncharacterized membrane protein